jgi:hypothetical protein
VNQPRGWHYAPAPIAVPSRLLDVFERLHAEAVLVGGAAVQVWVGRKDGLFATGDLDFITHLMVKELIPQGVQIEDSGRHVLIDGVPIEFPTGPLAVGAYIFAKGEAVVSVPTLDGRPILCFRPEACALDRLAWVAGDSLEVGYAQALAVTVSQHQQLEWDEAWVDRVATRAGLNNLWTHLKKDIASGHPGLEGLDMALRIGWDPGF